MLKTDITALKAVSAGIVLCLALFLCAEHADAQLAENDLIAGQSALADARYSDAEHSLVRYLAANHQNPVFCTNALNYLCMAVYKQKNFQNVLKLLDENADITGLDNTGTFEYWRARSILELGNIDEAVAIADNTVVNLKKDTIGAIRLYRLKGIALSRSLSPDAAEDARIAFSNANIRASSLTEDLANGFRLDNYLDWAESELKFGYKANAENILSDQQELSHSVSNSVSAQKGAIQYAKLLVSSGHTNEANTILSKIADDKNAHHANRAEAIVTIASICSDTNRLNTVYSVLCGLELSPAIIAEAKMRFGKEIALKDNDAFQLTGVKILSSSVKCNTTSPFARDCQLILANTWMRLGSNSLAAAEFKNYSDAFGGEKNKDFIAKKGCATALFSLKNYDEAALIFTEAAELAETTLESSKCLSMAADSYYNSSKFSRAAELYKQAAAKALVAENSELSLQCRIKSADAVEKTGDLNSALEEFKDIASDPKAGEYSRKANLRRAIIFEQQDYKEEAESTYSSVLENEQENQITVSARLGRGRTRYRRFKFESAIVDLKLIPQSYTNEADEAAYIIILANYGLGKDEDAYKLAQTYIFKRPFAKNLSDVMLWAAQYDFNRKNFSAAENAFLKFAEKFPENQITQYALLWAADSAFRQSEFARANDTLSKISKLRSDNQVLPEARLLQARSLRELTRYEDTLSVLDEIITEFPADDLVVTALILKGETLFVLAGKEPGDKGYITAEKAFSNALLRSDIKPDQVIECSFNSARCYEKAGNYKKAADIYLNGTIDRYAQYTLSHIQLSAKAAGFFAKAVFNAAILLENEGDIEGAINTLGHLSTTSLPESEKASSEIRRLRTK